MRLGQRAGGPSGRITAPGGCPAWNRAPPDFRNPGLWVVPAPASPLSQKGSRRVPEGLDVRSKIPLRGCKSPLLLTFLWKIDRKTGGGERSPATGNCRREKSCLTDGIGLTCGLGCSACSLIPKVSGFRSFPTVRNVRKVFGTGQQVRASRLMLPDARFPTLAPRCVRSVDGSESSVARRGGVRKNLVATIHPRNNPTVAS